MPGRGDAQISGGDEGESAQLPLGLPVGPPGCGRRDCKSLSTAWVLVLNSEVGDLGTSCTGSRICNTELFSVLAAHYCDCDETVFIKPLASRMLFCPCPQPCCVCWLSPGFVKGGTVGAGCPSHLAPPPAERLGVLRGLCLQSCCSRPVKRLTGRSPPRVSLQCCLVYCYGARVRGRRADRER